MIKSYKSSIRRNLKNPNLLPQKISEALDKQGIVEVLTAMYSEIYLLKKQLMAKGVIVAEQAYLLDEIYSFLEEKDKETKKKN